MIIEIHMYGVYCDCCGILIGYFDEKPTDNEIREKGGICFDGAHVCGVACQKKYLYNKLTEQITSNKKEDGTL